MMAGIRRRYWQNHQFQDAEGLGFVERGHSCPRNPVHPQIPPGTLQSTFNAQIQLIPILSLG